MIDGNVPRGYNIERIFLSVLRYRLHISAIYFFLLLSAWWDYGIGPVNFPVLFLFLSWHFGLYLFDRAYDAEKDSMSQGPEAVPVNQKKMLIGISVGLVTMPVIILFLLKLPLLPYLLMVPFAFLYTFPLRPFLKVRVKDLFLLKNAYSAVIIWSFSVFWMIKYYGGQAPWTVEDYVLRFGSLLLLTLVGEIHWDIRDTASDRANGVLTLPVLVGINITKVILIGTLFVFYFGVSIGTSSSLVMMTLLILLADTGVSNIIYHIPPLVALFNFVIERNS